MAYSAIDIGSAASDRADAENSLNRCYVAKDNPANASGVLTSFEVYAVNGQNISGFKAGTFSNRTTSYFTARDVESIGAVTGGSKQTFGGKNCDVVSGDLSGFIFTGGQLELTRSTNNYYIAEDVFTQLGTEHNFSAASSYGPWSLYATGMTIPDAPTSVSATDNLTDKVTITWTAGTGETDGNRVYRDGVDISGVVAHDTATYDDTTGTVGTTYAYTVKAINPAGLSAASTADNGTRVSSSKAQILVTI